MSLKISKALVIGAGVMGQGIAQWLAQVGVQVCLYDQESQKAQLALEQIQKNWEKLCAKGKFSSSQIKLFSERISACRGLQSSLPSDCQLVIEAIIERELEKKNLLEFLDSHMQEDCFIATNTSGLSLAKMGQTLSKERKEKFLGLHFFNPAPIMKLIEIITTPWVSQEIVLEFQKWFSERNKIGVICKDVPGFIVNRVNRHFYGEAQRVVQIQTVSSLDSAKTAKEDKDLIKNFDHILKEVWGFKMGPFELMDLIGVDTNHTVTKTLWYQTFFDPRFAPHQMQQSYVDAGLSGQKSGEGFYVYERK